ncbi:unnamed protein product, partial [Didymodactylos carnosus]
IPLQIHMSLTTTILNSSKETTLSLFTVSIILYVTFRQLYPVLTFILFRNMPVVVASGTKATVIKQIELLPNDDKSNTLLLKPL